VRTQLAGVQVDGAVLDVEHPWVGVEARVEHGDLLTRRRDRDRCLESRAIL